MSAVVSRSSADATPWISSRSQRVVFLLITAATFNGAFLVTRSGGVEAADVELTRLLRGMALLKALMASFVVAGVFWRLERPASPMRFASYAVTCGLMASGPGLIWGMDHVRIGALLLHAGFACSLMMLWRDPAVSTRLSALLRARSRQ